MRRNESLLYVWNWREKTKEFAKMCENYFQVSFSQNEEDQNVLLGVHNKGATIFSLDESTTGSNTRTRKKFPDEVNITIIIPHLRLSNHEMYN